MAWTNHEIKSVDELKSKLGVDTLDTNTLKIDKPFSLTDADLETYKKQLSEMWDKAKAEKLAEIIKEKWWITQATKEAKGDLKETLKTWDIEKIKDFFTTWELNTETLKAFIENISEVQWENRTILLWLIFTLLNKQWVSISKLTSDVIELKAWKQTDGIKVANSGIVIDYQNIINSFGIKKGTISVADIQKALLYKTSWISTYIDTHENFSTNEYANELLKKYNDIFVKRGFRFTNLWETIDEENYKIAKKAIAEWMVDNQADREFLSVYFDDLFYSKSKMSNNMVNDFAKNKDTNKLALGALNLLWTLDDKTKYALWIWNSDVLAEKKEQFKNDPAGALKESLSNWWAQLWAILWLLWWIFWWKKWEWFSFSRLIAWFLGWVWLWAVWVDGLKTIAKKWAEWAWEWTNVAYNWVKEKLTPLWNFSQEVYEKAEFWYDFSAVQINDWTGTKDLMDSKFVFLHDKANTDIWLFQKDGKELSTEEQTKLKDKLNEYMEELKKKYPDKNQNKIKEIFKDKPLKEIIAEIYKDEKKSETKPTNWSNQQLAQNSNTPTWNLDFSHI